MIKPRERQAILQSLRAGVVPRVGLRHIQVGRKEEVAAILKDLEAVKQGSACVRFVIGRYGAGKSFFLNLARLVALEQQYVVVQADLTPDRRLHATGGQAQALFSELMRNAAVRSKPDGGALPGIVERWVSEIDHGVRSDGGDDGAVAKVLHDGLKTLQELVSGYDFATVLTRYHEGYRTQNDALMESALKWLRAEYATRTEATRELGVRSIIGDQDVYDYLKLFAAFVRHAGYSGLIVSLDEMGVLSHRLNHAQARNANYEMVLRIVNDCLQGNVAHLGFLFAGTDEFLDDRRRGLASYEALATRLAENRFAAGGLKDYSGPVIRLPNLAPEDLYVLLRNLRHVFAGGDEANYLVPDEALAAFLQHCANTLGASFYQTPRDAVKSFVGLLSVLEQNPGQDWRGLLATSVESDPTDDPALAGGSGDDDLATFRL